MAITYDPSKLADPASLGIGQQAQKGNTIADWLPTIGSVLGPVAAGLIAAPLTGGLSLPVALGAAAAGGALGEFGKEKITKQKTDVGSIATQGALGAGGELLGAGIGKVLGFGGKLLGDTAGGVEKSIINPKVAAKVGGAQEEERLVQQALQELPRGSADSMYKALQPKMTALEGEIAAHPELKVKLNKEEIAQLIEQGIKDSGAYVSGNKEATKLAEEIMSRVKNKLPDNPTVEDLLAFKRELKNYRPVASAFAKEVRGTTLLPKEQLYKDAWHAVDEALTAKAPGIKELTLRESALHKLADGLKQDGANLGLPFKGGLKIPLPKGVGQAAAMNLAGAAKPAGAAIAGAGRSPMLNSILGQAGVRTFAGGGQTNAPYAADSSGTGVTLGSPASDITSMLQQTTATNPIAQEQEKLSALNQRFAQAILMDTIYNKGKDVAALTAMQKLMAAASPVAKLTAQQKTALEGIDNATAHLSVLESQLESIGLGTGPSARVTGEVKNLMGQIGLNPNAQAYNQARQVLALSLAKALSGSSRGSEAVLKLAQEAIPRLTDTEQEKNIAFARLRQYLAMAKSNIYTDAAAGTDTSTTDPTVDTSATSGGIF